MKSKEKIYSENDIYIAFKTMLKRNGMFGIKPSEYWIDAIWNKDFKTKL